MYRQHHILNHKCSHNEKKKAIFKTLGILRSSPSAGFCFISSSADSQLIGLMLHTRIMFQVSTEQRVRELNCNLNTFFSCEEINFNDTAAAFVHILYTFTILYSVCCQVIEIRTESNIQSAEITDGDDNVDLQLVQTYSIHQSAQNCPLGLK